MTLETQTPRVVIIGNGTRGPYSLVDSSAQAIRFVSTSHLRLTRYTTASDTNGSGTLLVEDTDYTVAGTGDARTFTLASGQAVLTSNQRILAERVQSYTQDLDLTNGGAFNAVAVEARLNKIVEFQQELKSRLDRVPVLQFADATANVALPSVPSSLSLLARSSTGALVHATAADFGSGTTVDAAWLAILGVTPGDEWADLLSVDARVFAVDAYSNAAAVAGDWTTAIQACSAALEAAGGGTMWFTPGKTYAVYPDATNTTALGDFDNCNGVHLAFNGCTFTIARAFTGSQVIFCWTFDGCSGVSWGDYTVTCAQVDAPVDALSRGIWWLTTANTTDITGGHGVQTGGRVGLDFVREVSDVTLQCRRIRIASLTTTNVFYPLGCRNTGIDVHVGCVDATNGGRVVTAYGHRNVYIYNLRIKDQYATSTVAASGVGAPLYLNDASGDGFYAKLTVIAATTYYSTLFGVHLIGNGAASARGIELDLDDCAFSGVSGSEQLVYLNKYDSTNTIDTAPSRGHYVDIKITGKARGFNNATGMVFADFGGDRTTHGDWSGETVDLEFGVECIGATASHKILGDFTPMARRPRLDSLIFGGVQEWHGYRTPGGLTLPNRFVNGDMRIDQRNAGSAQTFTAAAAKAYCIDRFYASCTGANVNGQRVAGAGPDQYRYQFTGAASVTGIIFGQRIASTNIMDLVSTTATFSVELANSVLTTVTWTAYYPTATDDYTAQTQIATGTFTVTSTIKTYAIPVALGANVTAGLTIELSVGAQTSGTWTIGEFQIVGSQSLLPFERLPEEQQARLCRRYYRKQDFYVPATTAQNLGVIDMREVPTIAGGGGGFTSTGTTADTLIAFQTAGAVATLTLDAEI